MPVIIGGLMKLFNIDNHHNIFIQIMGYFPYTDNILIGLFILFESSRIVKNKISISILGFCIPIIGVCFLMIENYLLQKSFKNE